MQNCLSMGSVTTTNTSHNNVAAIIGNINNNTNLTGITNNYWLTGSSYAGYGGSKASDAKAPVEVSTEQLASGYVTAKLGYAFHQNLGDDENPTLDKTKGYVTQISAAGYSTQYITDSDVTIPSDIEAFAGVVNGSSLTLAPITGAIAAGEPVILRGDAGFYNFMPTTGASEADENDLLGSDGTVTGGDDIYALSKKDDVVGFYPVAASVTIPAGRVYLINPSEVKGFTFVFDDDATGIENVNVNDNLNEGAVYDLSGRKLSPVTSHLSPVRKGIYIVNGKKILK